MLGRPIAGLKLKPKATATAVAGSPAAGDTASTAGSPPPFTPPQPLDTSHNGNSSANTTPKPVIGSASPHAGAAASSDTPVAASPSNGSPQSVATPKPVIASASPGSAASAGAKKHKAKSALSLQLDEQLRQVAAARAAAAAQALAQTATATAVAPETVAVAPTNVSDSKEVSSDEPALVTVAFNVKPDGNVVVAGLGNTSLIREVDIDPRTAASASRPAVALTPEERKKQRQELLKAAREKRKQEADRRGVAQPRATQRKAKGFPGSRKPSLPAVPEISSEARESVAPSVVAGDIPVSPAVVVDVPNAATTVTATTSIADATAIPATTALGGSDTSALSFSRVAVVPAQATSELANDLKMVAWTHATASTPKAANPNSGNESYSASAAVASSPALLTLTDDEIKKLYLDILALEGKNKDQALSLNNPNQVYLLLKAKVGLYRRLLAVSDQPSQRLEGDELAVLEIEDWLVACSKVQNFVITKAEAEKIKTEAERQKAVAAASVNRLPAAVTPDTPNKDMFSVGARPSSRVAAKYTDDNLVDLYIRLITEDVEVVLGSTRYDEIARAAELRRRYDENDLTAKALVLKTVKIGLYRRLLKAHGHDDQAEKFSERNTLEQYNLVKDLTITQEDARLLFDKSKQNREQREREEKAKEAAELAAAQAENQRVLADVAREERFRLAFSKGVLKAIPKSPEEIAAAEKRIARSERLKAQRTTEAQKKAEALKQKQQKDEKARDINAKLQAERIERQAIDESMILLEVGRMNRMIETGHVVTEQDESTTEVFEVTHKSKKKKSSTLRLEPTLPSSPASADRIATERSPSPSAAVHLSSSAPIASAMPKASKSRAVITRRPDGGIDMDLTGDSAESAQVPRSKPIDTKAVESSPASSNSSPSLTRRDNAASPVAAPSQTSPSSNSSSGDSSEWEAAVVQPVSETSLLEHKEAMSGAAPSNVAQPVVLAAINIRHRQNYPVKPTSWKMPALATTLVAVGGGAAAVGVWAFGLGAIPGIIIAGIGGVLGAIPAIRHAYDRYQYAKALKKYLKEFYIDSSPVEGLNPPKKIYTSRENPACRIIQHHDGRIIIDVNGVKQSATGLGDAVKTMGDAIDRSRMAPSHSPAAVAVPATIPRSSSTSKMMTIDPAVMAFMQKVQVIENVKKYVALAQAAADKAARRVADIERMVNAIWNPAQLNQQEIVRINQDFQEAKDEVNKAKTLLADVNLEQANLQKARDAGASAAVAKIYMKSEALIKATNNVTAIFKRIGVAIKQINVKNALAAQKEFNQKFKNVDSDVYTAKEDRTFELKGHPGFRVICKKSADSFTVMMDGGFASQVTGYGVVLAMSDQYKAEVAVRNADKPRAEQVLSPIMRAASPTRA